MRELPIQGVELSNDGRELSILTHEPGDFYSGLPEVVLGADVHVEMLSSADDNLEAVFNYLIAGE